MLGGGTLFGDRKCVRNRRWCKSHPSGGLGACPPPQENFEKNSCPEIKSGGFWQLADYPILVFKIHTHILTLVNAYWNKLLGFGLYILMLGPTGSFDPAHIIR